MVGVIRSKNDVWIVASSAGLFRIEFGYDEVGGLALVMDDIEGRFLPMNGVARFGIANMVALKLNLVPHSVALSVFQNSPVNIGACDGGGTFPGAIGNDKGIASMLLGRMKLPS